MSKKVSWSHPNEKHHPARIRFADTPAHSKISMTAPDYNAIIAAVLQPQVYRATKYVSPTQVLKATRRRFNGKLHNGRARRETLLLTLGQPNYRERQYIKLCKQAHEPFPIRKIQLTLLPQPR